MHTYHLLAKQANPLDKISIQPANKTHGMVAGGVGGGVAGAGLGALTGGAAGLASAFLDDEDDGIKSTLRKALKAALTGGAAGGVLGGAAGGLAGRAASGQVGQDIQSRMDTGSVLASLFANKRVREKIIKPGFQDARNEMLAAKVPLSKVMSDEKPVLSDISDVLRTNGATERVNASQAQRIADFNKAAAIDVRALWASIIAKNPT